MHILFSYVYVLACTVLILNFVTVQCINSNGSVTWTILSNISKIFSKKQVHVHIGIFQEKKLQVKSFVLQPMRQPMHGYQIKYIKNLNILHQIVSTLAAGITNTGHKASYSELSVKYLSWNWIFHTTNVPRQESQFHLATLQM